MACEEEIDSQNPIKILQYKKKITFFERNFTQEELTERKNEQSLQIKQENRQLIKKTIYNSIREYVNKEDFSIHLFVKDTNADGSTRSKNSSVLGAHPTVESDPKQVVLRWEILVSSFLNLPFSHHSVSAISYKDDEIIHLYIWCSGHWIARRIIDLTHPDLRTFHEVIFLSNRMIHPFFDIDADLKEANQSEETFQFAFKKDNLQAMFNVIQAYFDGIGITFSPLKDIMLFQRHDKPRGKCHMVFHTLQIPGNAMKDFAASLAECLPEIPLDLKMYNGKFHSFRLNYSNKVSLNGIETSSTKDIVWKLPIATVSRDYSENEVSRTLSSEEPYYRYSWSNNILLDIFVTFIGNSKTTIPFKIASKKTIDQSKIVPIEATEILENPMLLHNSKDFLDGWVFIGWRGTFFALKRQVIAPWDCPLCKRTHDNQMHSYITRGDANVYWKCYQNENKDGLKLMETTKLVSRKFF